MIAAHQKRISRGPQSLGGRLDEYEQDLAANEEDAKRLEKAEKSTGRKVAKQKKSNSSNQSNNWRSQPGEFQHLVHL